MKNAEQKLRALETQRIWRKNNREKVNAQKKRNYARHKEHFKQWRVKRYQRKKSKIDVANKKWAVANRDKVNGYIRNWKSNNREHVLKTGVIRQRKYFAENRDKVLQIVSNYVKRNPAIVAARKADYRHRNRDKEAAWAAKRNLAIGDAKKNPQIIQLIYSWKAAKDTKCYYCEKPLFGKEVQIDHIIPLSRGGKHELTNLCAACKPCNSSKHNKLPHEWRKEGQLLLV